MPEKNCEYCGSSLVNDIFEDEYIVWCPNCLKEHHDKIEDDFFTELSRIERERAIAEVSLPGRIEV